MHTKILFAGLTSLLFYGTACAQTSAADSVIAALSVKLNEQYVFPEKGQEMANKLTTAYRNQAYKGLTGNALAASLTQDLQAWSKDKHLRVSYSPDSLPPVDEVRMEIPAGQKAFYFEYLRHDNYGINKLEVLKGNIGYIDIKYFCTPEAAGDSYAAMMNYVANTDALIIDLRKCGGSTSPDAIPFVCSYLFDKPIHLNDLYWRKGNIVTQAWTYAYVSGKRYIGKPVYVLISHATFSGAEELAYDLKNLKRATLFGEATGGGANPGGDLTLTPHYTVFMPVGQAINPVTKTNWEGVGVTPDSAVKPALALHAATLAALRTIQQSTTDDGYKQYLSEVVAEVEKTAPQLLPVSFELSGYPKAKEVYVAGSFNGWSSNGLQMVRKGDKWIATGEAEAGKMAYKFVVDGVWITDPGNRETEQDGPNQSSVKIVKPVR